MASLITTVTNNRLTTTLTNQTLTTTLSRTGGQGSKGSQGAFYIKIYIRALVEPGKPTGGSFDFDSGTLTPPADWFIEVPVEEALGNTYTVESFVDPADGGTVVPVWSEVFAAGTDGPRGASVTSMEGSFNTEGVLTLTPFIDGVAGTPIVSPDLRGSDAVGDGGRGIGHSFVTNYDDLNTGTDPNASAYTLRGPSDTTITDTTPLGDISAIYINQIGVSGEDNTAELALIGVGTILQYVHGDIIIIFDITAVAPALTDNGAHMFTIDVVSVVGGTTFSDLNIDTGIDSTFSFTPVDNNDAGFNQSQIEGFADARAVFRYPDVEKTLVQSISSTTDSITVDGNTVTQTGEGLTTSEVDSRADARAEVRYPDVEKTLVQGISSTATSVTVDGNTVTQTTDGLSTSEVNDLADARALVRYPNVEKTLVQGISSTANSITVDGNTVTQTSDGSGGFEETTDTFPTGVVVTQTFSQEVDGTTYYIRGTTAGVTLYSATSSLNQGTSSVFDAISGNVVLSVFASSGTFNSVSSSSPTGGSVSSNVITWSDTSPFLASGTHSFSAVTSGTNSDSTTRSSSTSRSFSRFIPNFRMTNLPTQFSDFTGPLQPSNNVTSLGSPTYFATTSNFGDVANGTVNGFPASFPRVLQDVVSSPDTAGNTHTYQVYSLALSAGVSVTLS